MTGRVRCTALLDACVLYPIVMADALMSLTVAGLFAAKWTRRIEDEWVGNLESNRPELKGRLGARRDAMRQAVPDWEVEACPAIRIEQALPDPGDEHVIAAAMAGHADYIVTTNLRHFPKSVLAPLALAAIHPDAFIIARWDLAPITALRVFKQMRARWRSPQANASDFADRFDHVMMPAVANRLPEAAGLI